MLWSQTYELLGGAVASGVLRSDVIGLDWNEVWHPTVAQADTVLFAAGGTWNWPNWAINYVADKGGDEYPIREYRLDADPGNGYWQRHHADAPADLYDQQRQR